MAIEWSDVLELRGELFRLRDTLGAKAAETTAKFQEYRALLQAYREQKAEQ